MSAVRADQVPAYGETSPIETAHITTATIAGPRDFEDAIQVLPDIVAFAHTTYGEDEAGMPVSQLRVGLYDNQSRVAELLPMRILTRTGSSVRYVAFELDTNGARNGRMSADRLHDILGGGGAAMRLDLAVAGAAMDYSLVYTLNTIFNGDTAYLRRKRSTFMGRVRRMVSWFLASSPEESQSSLA